MPTTELDSWFAGTDVSSIAVGDGVLVNDDNYRSIPDGSVDLILTDPPFNIARESNFHTYENNRIHSYQVDGDKGWDTYGHGAFIDELRAWAVEFHRVLRTGGSFAVFCADAYVSHLIDALTAAGLKPKRTFTWRKPNAVPVNRAYMPMSACEFVVYGVKGSKPTFNADVTLHDGGLVDEDPLGVAEMESYLVADKAASIVAKVVRSAIGETGLPRGEARGRIAAQVANDAIAAAARDIAAKIDRMYTDEPPMLRACVPNYLENPSATGRTRIHPTEKPVSALRYLIAMMSSPGDVVLDPFSGSGSTGHAAIEMGRRPVLIERESEYFEKAAQRLREVARARGPEPAAGTANGTITIEDEGQLSMLDL